MLRELNISGFAIISSLNIKFSEGFNVITGETGTGKSVIIKSLNYLLGFRSSKLTLRSAEKGVIWARFDISRSSSIKNKLEEFGLPASDELIIRRSLSPSGKSLIYCNDAAITATSLKKIAQPLIDICSQHENNQLLHTSYHQKYLDQFLEDDKILSKYQSKYRSCLETVQAIKELAEKFYGKLKERDYIEFRCQEIKNNSLSTTEYYRLKEQLDDLQKKLSHQAKYQEILACINPEDGIGLSASLNLLIKKASQSDGLISKDEVASLSELSEVVDQISFNMEKKLSDSDQEGQDLDELESRFALYQSQIRKYRCQNIEELIDLYSNFIEDYEFLQNFKTEIVELNSSLAKQIIQLEGACKKLNSARKKASSELEAALAKEFKDISMEGAKFKVDFFDLNESQDLKLLEVLEPGNSEKSSVSDQSLWGDLHESLKDFSSYGLYGNKRARFLLASNPGEAFKELEKVASGGEMSRITLSIKKALSVGADSMILVFDEIDTGLSGRVADKVGRKIAETAENMQIICISHLPQVAAYADTHFKVEKVSRGSGTKSIRTESKIRKLTAKESTEELARMLSSDKITEASIANASIMKKKASRPPSAGL